MKHTIKILIRKFATWLWFRVYEKTATEIAILHEIDNQCCCQRCWIKEQKSNYDWLCENHENKKN